MRTLSSAPTPYGHFHVVMLSHCIPFPRVSPHYSLSLFFFLGHLYRELAYVELVVVELYQLGSYDTLIQYLTWNLHERQGE